jgi:beta-lactamase superfamily II metal-dependent hydrolase
VENFIYNNVPTVEHFPSAMQEHNSSREAAWSTAMDCYPNAKRIQPSAGDKIALGNAVLHILATANDPYPAISIDPNYSSMVLKITFDNGKSLMLLGDAMGERLTALVEPTASIYCTDEVLKSDILQIAHHGLCVTENLEEYPAVLRLYEKIAPTIAFWSQNEKRFYADPWCRAEKHTYHKFLFDTVKERNFNQAYTTIVDMEDLSITFEKRFIEVN